MDYNPDLCICGFCDNCHESKEGDILTCSNDGLPVCVAHTCEGFELSDQ